VASADGNSPFWFSGIDVAPALYGIKLVTAATALTGAFANILADRNDYDRWVGACRA
jgi:hypothetical protein